MKQEGGKSTKAFNQVKNSIIADDAEAGRINHGPDALRRIRPAITAKSKRFRVDSIARLPAGGGAYMVYLVVIGKTCMCECDSVAKANRIKRALNAAATICA